MHFLCYTLFYTKEDFIRNKDLCKDKNFFKVDTT